MIKVFRPFWSFDVKKTEDWLAAMAKKGYYLVKLNRWTRCFFFQQSEPTAKTFRIGYDKIKMDPFPGSLLGEGWEKIFQGGRWYALANDKPIGQINISPVRDGIIKHNRIFLFIYSGILTYFSMIALLFLTIFGLIFFTDVPVEVVDSPVDDKPLWIFDFLYLILELGVIVLSIYSIIKIAKSNKSLMNENQIHHLPTERFSKEKEKQLKQSGQLLVKRKIGWMYSPDKLEKWLETMEENGLNLYRVGKTGTAFYFIKGSPRKVRYCADYQNRTDNSYFDIHRGAGWKNEFFTKLSFQKWTIWSREYGENEVPPQIYSDKSHRLKHAKRIAFTYSVIFLPLVIIYTFDMFMFIKFQSQDHATKLDIYTMAMFIFAIFSLGSFTIRTWLYYWRLRKQ